MHRGARAAELYKRAPDILSKDQENNRSQPIDLHSVFPSELINATGTVHNLLLAGIERVA